MLVDGCLLDNVPMRTMHELKSGPNVVVSFDVPKLERFDVDYEHAAVARRAAARHGVNPFCAQRAAAPRPASAPC